MYTVYFSAHKPNATHWKWTCFSHTFAKKNRLKQRERGSDLDLYDLFETRVRFDFELTDLGKVVAALDLVCRWIVAAPHNKWLLIIMVDTGNKCGAQSGYPFQLILFRNANLIIISSFVLAGKPSHGSTLPARKRQRILSYRPYSQ